VQYSNADIPAPSISFIYDLSYQRPTVMSDGVGTTTYTYKASATLGAGQLASIDGPLANDTISYTYDAVGRVVGRAINGTANSVSWSFDVLGRVTGEINLLGTFSYEYDGYTDRLKTITYPNSQVTSYTYMSGQSHRLATIQNNNVDGSTLSRFDYTYDPVGNILTWRQEAGGPAARWRYTFDGASQKRSATKESTDATPVTQKRYRFEYDPAGNRISEQNDDGVTTAAHNKLNQLVARFSGGPLAFVGNVNEPATVTVQGLPAAVTPMNEFIATPSLVSGSNTVTISATDAAGNSTTKQWSVSTSGDAATYLYDSNGNMVSDGVRTFEWDAENRLLAAVVGSTRQEFSYDGYGRRVRVVKKENGVTTTDERFVWCGDRICEVRSADGATVTQRHFTHGSQGNITSFYTRDHLGSVRETTDGTGVLQARYEYDSWGRKTDVSGTMQTPFAFSGHPFDSATGLVFAPHRVYDAVLGRWISQDAGDHAVFLREGPNLYAYVGNRPLTLVDPTGKSAAKAGGMAGLAAATIFALLCVRIVEQTWTNWQNPYEHKDPSQRLKHCIAECEITKNCLGGSLTAAVAGWAREEFGDHDEGDKDAGEKGRQAANECPEGICFIQCENVLGLKR
jgi:RHS repeat-associated protein